MSNYVATLARKVGDVADLVHKASAPVTDDGSGPAEPGPSFLKQCIEDVHGQIVRGKPFSLDDLPAYVDAVKHLNSGGIDDRKFLLEKILVLMSRLPTSSKFAKTLQDFVIDTLYKDLPHPPASYLATPSTTIYAPPTFSYTNSAYTNGSANPSSAHTTKHKSPRLHYASRPADGSFNNPLFPNLGKAGEPYARSVPALGCASRQALPDPGLVFDALLMRRPSTGEGGVINGVNGVNRRKKSKRGRGRVNGTSNGVNDNEVNATGDDGFTAHPGGISSLFFAFADLVIHSIFDTAHGDYAINNASSYLDLSPLYGSSQEAVNTYIADTILSINERGTYTDPLVLEQNNEYEKLQAQDDELFERARMVNCGFFMQIILGDYVGAILGLVRDGLDWRLDPLSAMRELDHEPSPRGAGNACSIEFNLLYRWHATLSRPDTQWTEKMFGDLFEGKPFGEITVDDFKRVARKRMTVDDDVRKWSFDGPTGTLLAREQETNRYPDADLAEILQNATEASASAFKARGIPEVMRVIEIMGIEQSRSWGACSLNEFRSFMGLKPYESFKEWNPDPEIYTAAEALYEDIDHLELHVGMQAEEAKPAIPGSGLCPGYTISRAILADAVALTRGDRFLTTEFTPYNLTTWGYQDCFPDKNDGSYGGNLTRMLYRHLPAYYPPGSAYAHFPFLVPTKVKGYLAAQRDSPMAKYTYSRPPVPEKVVVVKDFEGVQAVLAREKVFVGPEVERLGMLTKGAWIDMRMVNDALSSPGFVKNAGDHIRGITAQLIRDKSLEHVGRNYMYVDVVKDVISLVPVHFVASYLAGIPLKTAASPHGVYPEKQLFEMLSTVCNYVFLNADSYHNWVLQNKSCATAEAIIDLIHQHLQKIQPGFLSFGALSDSIIHWVTGEDTRSHEFLKLVSAGTKGRRLHDLARSIFAAVVTTTTLYSKAVAQIVDFYLDDDRRDACEDLAGFCRDPSPQSTVQILKFVREALRLNPVVSSVVRTAKSQATLRDGTKVLPGQKVYCSLTSANYDTSVFGPDPAVPDYERSQTGLVPLAEHGLLNTTFFEATVPQVLRTIFTLKNVRRAPNQSGKLNAFMHTVHDYPEKAFIDFKGQISPFPVSMLLHYDL